MVADLDSRSQNEARRRSIQVLATLLPVCRYHSLANPTVRHHLTALLGPASLTFRPFHAPYFHSHALISPRLIRQQHVTLSASAVLIRPFHSLSKKYLDLFKSTTKPILPFPPWN
jgi:hypothetical protein